MATLLHRLGHDVQQGWRLLRAGGTLRATLLYPIRRRFFARQHQVEFRNGSRIFAPADEPILPMIQRIWRRRVYLPPGCRLRPGDTVVDVGANVGVFTVWAASHPGVRVIALEPSPRICGFLRKNVEASGLQDVVVREAACASTDGRATLYSHGYETNNSLYARDVFGGSYEASGEVQTRSLESLFREFEVERCALLKMNCEGAEYDIILNAPPSVMAKIDAIAMEYHRGRVASTPEQLQALLESAGFNVDLQPLHDEEGGYLYATRPMRA